MHSSGEILEDFCQRKNFSIHTHNLRGTKQKYWQKAAACFVIKTMIYDINIDRFGG